MKIIMLILLVMTVLLEGFAVYVLGVISAKLDLIEAGMRAAAAEKQNVNEELGEKQMRALLNYNGNERREVD